MSHLQRILVETFGHEGGYVNHPRDPGGETKYGIAKRSHPTVDISALTLDGAAAIYERDYWNKTPAPNVVTYELASAIFDAAVNSGPAAAVKWLQLAIGLDGSKADGKWGPASRAAFNACLLTNGTSEEEMNDAERIIAARLHGHRLDAMTYMRWDDFGRGWARRIAAQLKRLSF